MVYGVRRPTTNWSWGRHCSKRLRAQNLSPYSVQTPKCEVLLLTAVFVSIYCHSHFSGWDKWAAKCRLFSIREYWRCTWHCQRVLLNYGLSWSWCPFWPRWTVWFIMCVAFFLKNKTRSEIVNIFLGCSQTPLEEYSTNWPRPPILGSNLVKL